MKVTTLAELQKALCIQEPGENTEKITAKILYLRKWLELVTGLNISRRQLDEALRKLGIKTNLILDVLPGITYQTEVVEFYAPKGLYGEFRLVLFYGYVGVLKNNRQSLKAANEFISRRAQYYKGIEEQKL